MTDYKEYFQDVGSRLTVERHGSKEKLLPLPTIDDMTPDTEIASAIGQLKDVTCLTHACYMSKADVKAREIYVKNAVEMNKKRKKARDRIRDLLIESVNQGRGKHKEVAVPDLTLTGASHER